MGVSSKYIDSANPASANRGIPTMRKILIAIAFALTFVVSAQAQVNPRLVGDKNVFKMEDEAIERWKVALPRLSQDWGGLSGGVETTEGTP